MYHDGKTYIWIPSALTLSFLTVDSAAFINAVHTAINAQLGVNYKKTDYAAGLQPHEYYLLMNDLDMGGAPFTRDVAVWPFTIGGVERQLPMSVCGPIENVGYLTPDYCSVICAFGGDVEALPVWFEIDGLETVCPFGDGEETWEAWGTFEESHKPVQIGDKWYRSNAVGTSGQLLDASTWVPLRSAGQLVVKTKAEFLAIQVV